MYIYPHFSKQMFLKNDLEFKHGKTYLMELLSRKAFACQFLKSKKKNLNNQDGQLLIWRILVNVFFIFFYFDQLFIVSKA